VKKGTRKARSSARIAALPAIECTKAIDERVAAGRAIRGSVPRGTHAHWAAPPRRRDPIGLLIESGEGRLRELLPIRYGRMLQSPFAFYRGAAAVMAADLAHTETSGIQVQLCGDCHLANFGGYATPERRVVFDLNDFDETLPGPWEWDVKRLVASFVVACRNNRLPRRDARASALACASSYRRHTIEYAGAPPLEVWYSRIDAETAVAAFTDRATSARIRRRLQKAARGNVPEHDFPKLAEATGSSLRIRDNPPLIFHPADANAGRFKRNLHDAFARYRQSLADDRRHLLDRYQLLDIAQKVVGVGSVGTWCGVMLLVSAGNSPLFLQVKEACKSVLEPYLGRSAYSNRGQRVVMGQRLTQSASDIFLGWTEGIEGRHFYVRQLRDMKIKPLIEIFDATVMRQYAELCGWALAHAHARSGDAARIAGYLGKRDTFDTALAAFGERYADQNERDYDALKRAVASGRIEAAAEV
jgi:uncharacterized protein (DUF2252 family)